MDFPSVLLSPKLLYLSLTSQQIFLFKVPNSLLTFFLEQNRDKISVKVKCKLSTYWEHCKYFKLLSKVLLWAAWVILGIFLGEWTTYPQASTFAKWGISENKVSWFGGCHVKDDPRSTLPDKGYFAKWQFLQLGNLQFCWVRKFHSVCCIQHSIVMKLSKMNANCHGSTFII